MQRTHTNSFNLWHSTPQFFNGEWSILFSGTQSSCQSARSVVAGVPDTKWVYQILPVGQEPESDEGNPSTENDKP